MINIVTKSPKFGIPLIHKEICVIFKSEICDYIKRISLYRKGDSQKLGDFATINKSCINFALCILVWSKIVLFNIASLMFLKD